MAAEEGGMAEAVASVAAEVSTAAASAVVDFVEAVSAMAATTAGTGIPTVMVATMTTKMWEAVIWFASA
jgi:hypothetical protein